MSKFSFRLVGSVVLENKKEGETLHLDACMHSHTYFPLLLLIQNTNALSKVLTNHIYASYEANKCVCHAGRQVHALYCSSLRLE